MFPDSFVVIPSPSTSLRTGSAEESLNIVPHCCPASRVRSPQRGRLVMATFQLKHHSLNVPVVLVPTQELQTFVRVAPLQNLDGFLASAPRIHFALIGHV